MIATTGWECSVMNPFCTSTTTRTGLGWLMSRPVASTDRSQVVTLMMRTSASGIVVRAATIAAA